jgi:uncharacterized membrane protein
MEQPAWAHAVIREVRDNPKLDPLVDRVTSAAQVAFGDGALADALHGTWLGHPLHPMLTDLPIGFWTSAMVLDLVGGDAAADAARALVAWGVVSAIPTALAGAVDWRSLDRPPRRVGIVHGALNGAAIVLYAASWAAHRKGRRSMIGIALGMAGGTAASVAGYLGGELVFPSAPDESDPDEPTPTRA